MFKSKVELERKETANTEACRLEERMAVLEEELARLKQATKEANEKMRD